MGVKYSKVVNLSGAAKDWKLQNVDVYFVRSKVIGVSKKFKKNGIYFLSKEELKWAFDFSDLQIFQCLQIFDFSNTMRVSCLDFWGALVLSGTDSVQEKINFCFKMMDLNNDGFLSFNDLLVLIMCITRGITRLKGYAAIPSDIIDKLVISAFKSTKVLSENGEISNTDLRTYILSNDYARTYLASLGAKVPTVDTSAIVSKRTTLQTEVAAIQAEIARVMCDLSEVGEDAESFLRERGGDADFVKISPSDMPQSSVAHVVTGVESGGSTAERPKSSSNSHHPPTNRNAQPGSQSTSHLTIIPEKSLKASLVASLRHATRINKHVNSIDAVSSLAHKSRLLSELVQQLSAHESARYFQETDFYAEAFAESKLMGPAGTSRNIFGESFRASLLLLWNKLPRNEKAKDSLAALDEFTLMNLFDNVAIVLPYHHARLCLREYVRPSQMGKYNFDEILRWYQLYGSSARILLNRPRDEYVYNSYSGAQSEIFQLYMSCCKALQDGLDKIRTQRGILNHVQGLERDVACRYHSSKRVIVQVNSRVKLERSKSSDNVKEQQNNLVQKWVEFRNLSAKKPSTVNLKYYFGHPEIVPNISLSEANDSVAVVVSTSSKKNQKPIPAPVPTTAISASAAANKAGLDHFHRKFKTIKLEEIKDWGMRLQLSMSSNPFTNLSTKRPKDMSRLKVLSSKPTSYLYDTEGSGVADYIEDYSNLQSQDLLDYMNLFMENEYNEKVSAALASEDNATSTEKDTLKSNINSPYVNNKGTRQSLNYSAPPPPPRNVNVYSSVMWFTLELRQKMYYSQEKLLIAALENFFLSVPFQLRQHLYTKVFVHGFNVFSEDKNSKSSEGAAQKLSAMMKTFMKSASVAADLDEQDSEQDEYYHYKGRRVVLVALYHETDYFQDVERLLVESDVFISRAVHRMNLEVVTRDSLLDMLRVSQQFEHYEEKLYGPQESELGEEGMNPLKYAKNMRGEKKNISDLISRLTNKTVPRDEMLRLCRQYGCKDTGTLAEMGEIVLRAVQMHSELLGYGDLSKFGRELVEKVFAKYKPSPENKGEYRPPPVEGKDYDSGMLLWEFNKLLAAADAKTVYDNVEYKTILAELEVLLDRSGHLKVEGLMNYYINNGRLATDNNRMGVGSLDESLKGLLTFNSTYEPDALGSLLSLVGRNNIVVDRLIKYVVYLSALRDVKLDGELDALSELFDLLQHFVVPEAHFNDNKTADSNVNPMGSISSLLKTPGWLATAVNKLSEYLADGEDGVVPTMRAVAREAFGKYDNWTTVCNEDVVNKVRVDVRAMEDAMAAQLEADLQARINQKRLDKQAAQEAREQLSPLELAKLKKEEDAVAATREGDTPVEAVPEKEEEIEVESVFVIKQRREQLIRQIVIGILPPLSDYNSTDFPAELLQLKEDLIFMFGLNLDPSVVLSLEESNLLEKKKESHLKRIEQISEQVLNNERLQAAHSCALYDCVRLFCTSVSNGGAGSRDFCLRMANEGMNILEMLPPGLGEFSPVKQAYTDKMERAHQRKVSALAALERERARRNMTDEDREVLRLEQLAAQMKQWEGEEAQMYLDACEALYSAREERKSTVQLGAMVKLWENLMTIKEQRHPHTLQCAVAQNNVGCLLLEFYGLDHPMGTGSVFVFQSAAEFVMTKARAVADRVEEENSKRRAEEAEELRLQRIQSGEDVNDELSFHSATMDSDQEENDDAVSRQDSVTSRTRGDQTHRQPSMDSITVGSVSIMSVNSGSQAATTNVSVDNKPNPFADKMTSVMETSELLPSIVILANYVTALIQTESTTTLRQCFDIKNYVYQLLQLLDEKQRDKLDNGVINTIRGMDVFCFVKPRDCLEPIVREVVFHFSEIQRHIDEEKQRILDQEAAAQKALEDILIEKALPPPTKAQLRKEKKRKYAEQRKLDAAKRGETSKQRKMLYELIQTDQITAIFNARASKVTLANAPKWGSVADLDLEEKDNALTGLASGLSSKPQARGSVKVLKSTKMSSTGPLSEKK